MRSLGKSNTYASTEAGKLVENILRNVVTGKQAEGLPSTEGMHGIAMQNKPTEATIENDVRKLRSAFVLEGKSKNLRRLTPKIKEKIIRDRIARIGHTGKSLHYPNWMESTKGRITTIGNDTTDKTLVEIQCKGLKPRAKFKSTQGGVSHFQKTIGIASNAVSETALSAGYYLKKKITQDIRKFFK
jgi:hypothetical protein